jgi:hypothetical protein
MQALFLFSAINYNCSAKKIQAFPADEQLSSIMGYRPVIQQANEGRSPFCDAVKIDVPHRVYFRPALNLCQARQ